MDIQAINVGQGLVLTDSGETLPISVYLDDEGDECGPGDNVKALVVQGTDGLWYAVPADEYEAATVQ